MEAQEGQRRIARHALEHLAGSDAGVSLLRRALRDAMRAVQEGRDPQNLFRDPGHNHALVTSCWNTVMTPEQYEEMRASIPAEAARRQTAARVETKPAAPVA
jgi:hypothetical protein